MTSCLVRPLKAVLMETFSMIEALLVMSKRGCIKAQTLIRTECESSYRKKKKALKNMAEKKMMTIMTNKMMKKERMSTLIKTLSQ
jgi:hypothetical protein